MSTNADDVIPNASLVPPAPPSAVDDIVPPHALIATEEPKVGWAEENLAGPSEIIGSAIANIPYGAIHGVHDFVTGGAPDTPAIKAWQVPLGAGGKKLLSDISAMIPARNDTNQPDDTAIPEFSEGTRSLIGHTLRVGSDVGSILAPVAIAKDLFTKAPAVETAAESAPKASFDSPPVEGGLPSEVAKDLSFFGNVGSPSILLEEMPLGS